MSGPKVIAWEPPPERAYRALEDDLWKPVAADLVAHPGVWAIIEEVPESTPNRATSLATRVKSGYGPWFPPKKFEAVTRTHREGSRAVVRVYARYVGPARSS